MWCSKCELRSVHVKNFDRIVCKRGHLLCTDCLEGNVCPLCGEKLKQKIKMFVDGTPKIFCLPIDSDNASDCQRSFSDSQPEGTAHGVETQSEPLEFSDNDTAERRSSIFQFSSDFGNELENVGRDRRPPGLETVKPEVIDLHPPAKNFLSEEEDDRSSIKIPQHPPSLKGSYSSICVASSRSLSRFKTKSEENMKINVEKISTPCYPEETIPKAVPIKVDPKELYLKTFYSGRNDDDSFDARSHYYKTMAELNACREFFVQSSLQHGDGNRRCNNNFIEEIGTSSDTIHKSANFKPPSQKIVEHLKEFRRETRYKPPKKFKVYKNYSETSGNMIITSSNSSQSTIEYPEKERYYVVKNPTNETLAPAESIPSVEKDVQKDVSIPQISDPRAIEIREKFKAEILLNLENAATVATNRNSFIENGTISDLMMLNPNLTSLLKSESIKPLDSPNSKRSSCGHTLKTVSIQPRVQTMHPFLFFSASSEQKRVEELNKFKTEIREKLKSEIFSAFSETEKNADPEVKEKLNRFIEYNGNYLINNHPLSPSTSSKKLSPVRKRSQPNGDDLSQFNLDLVLQHEESGTEDTEPTTVSKSLRHCDFLYDSAQPSTAASTACRAFAYSTEFYKSGPPLKLTPLELNLNREDAATAAPIFGVYPKSIAEINIDRSPVKCPITSCEKFIFISSISKHIKIDHQKILIESITPGRWRNMFLDPRIDRNGVNKCQMFYLISDKITGLGNSIYKDYLPLMVMSTRVDVKDLFNNNDPHDQYDSNNADTFLMIWLTGLCVTEVPIYYSLAVWSDYQNPNRPKKFKHPTTCHLVHSKKLYSLRNEQDHATLYKSGSALIVTEEQWKLLSDYGRNMIELQIFVH